MLILPIDTLFSGMYDPEEDKDRGRRENRLAVGDGGMLIRDLPVRTIGELAALSESECPSLLESSNITPSLGGLNPDLLGDGGTDFVDRRGRRLLQKSSAGLDIADNDDMREEMTSGDEAGIVLPLVPGLRP